MNERTIFHIDLDCFYASVEMQLNPKLRDKPVAVCGDVEKRHGIILAKSYEAKKYNIKTGEALWEAKKKCPELILVPANFKAYQYYSKLVKDIYLQYSDKVEAFGLDENWIDVTETLHLFGNDAFELAKRIQEEILVKTGLRASIGIGWNKIIAKFGSDKNKPFGITHITRDNFKHLFWDSPVEELLYVGHATKIKLNKWQIYTIGDLAKDEYKLVEKYGGKIGRMLVMWANGYDSTLVGCLFEDVEQCKSVGNSITTPKDIETKADCDIVVQVLSEAVATRLKQINMAGKVVSVYIRTSSLTSYSKRKTIHIPTNISSEIHSIAMHLICDVYDFNEHLRSVGISISNLKQDTEILQLDLFDEAKQRENNKKIDNVIDKIREKFGYEKICKCSIKMNKELTSFNPLSHTIHPIRYLKGPI